jgi:hypothetical protein
MTAARSMNRGGRRGFAMLEALAVLALLTVVVTMVTEVGVWLLGERQRTLVRQEAVETAANMLEAARAVPWDELGPDWAKAQHLPESLAKLPESRLVVRVSPEPGHPRTKRVSVAIHARPARANPLDMEMVSLFSARSASAAGGKR